MLRPILMLNSVRKSYAKNHTPVESLIYINAMEGPFYMWFPDLFVPICRLCDDKHQPKVSQYFTVQALGTVSQDACFMRVGFKVC